MELNVAAKTNYMARCGKCGKEVGCGCNLIDGSCHTCYSQALPTEQQPIVAKSTKRIVYNQTPSAPPEPNEFEKILKTKGLSKDEKIKRINDILEKARQHVANQSQNTGS